MARALLNPSDQAARHAFPDFEPAAAVRQPVEVGRDVALALTRLCDPDGDLGGMLDGPTRLALTDCGGPRVLLAAPMVDVDLPRVNANRPALPVLMAVIGCWLNYALLRADLDTLDYLSRLLGEADVDRVSVTDQAGGGTSTSRSQQQERLATADALRQLPPGAGASRPGEPVTRTGDVPASA